jgi:hypothetical protein
VREPKSLVELLALGLSGRRIIFGIGLASPPPTGGERHMSGSHYVSKG